MTGTLHTKYRPRAFKDVIGQTPVVNALSKALEKGTSRTFLLTGPTGTGKTTLARIAAKTVGCKPNSIQEVDAATYTGIDDIRALTVPLQYAPIDGQPRAMIIDECHALSAAAWKALLKPLEEPPSHLYWFLCTTELGKVPANIKSRCTAFTLKPVPVNDMLHLLQKIAMEEPDLVVGEAILDLCAKEANGSPRQAIVNLEACSGTKKLSVAKELLASAIDNPQVIDLARALLNNKKWKEVREILKGMKDTNAESVRHVIRAYMTNCALSMPNADRALEVLDAFSAPFPSGDQLSPVVLACGKLLLGED